MLYESENKKLNLIVLIFDSVHKKRLFIYVLITFLIFIYFYFRLQLKKLLSVFLFTSFNVFKFLFSVKRF